MKRILFILFLLISFQSFGQNRFPSIDSLQNYILRYFRNSTVETFTNLRGQNIVYGLSEFIDSLAGNGAVDSIWIVDAATDTLKYRKQGVTYVVGAISGGGGGSQSLDDVLTVGNFSTNSVRARFQVRNSGNTTTLGDWFNNGNTTSELYIYNTNGRQSLLTYNNLEFKATGSNYQSIRPHASPSAAYTTFNLPNTGAVQRYFPMTFKLNGTTVAAGDTGLVDLGTIASGVPYTLINGGNNLGSGSQVFKDTSSNKLNFRSLTAGWGLDVTQNTNDIEYKADTAQLATSTAVRDTAAALRYLISGESVAWGTYAQRVALTGMVAGQRFYQTNERIGPWFYDGSEWIHSPPSSSVRNASMAFSSAMGTGTSGSGAAAAHSSTGTTFKMSGGYAYVSTGTTSTGFALVYAQNNANVPRTGIPADSADNGYKMVLVGKVALLDAPTASEDFRFNFGTRNQAATFVNDSTSYGYVFSIARYRNSSFIECYTGQRGGQPVITTTTSVPFSSAVFPLVSGYPTDISQAIEGFITFVLVYNTKYVDYYINGTLVASHTLTSSRVNNTGFNDWVLSIAKTTGNTSRTAVLESVYSYYIKDNF